MIIENHYSGTVAKGVVYHLGIFIDETLFGVAQFGYGIKPKQTCLWVRGTKPNEYLELNRLWISDKLGKNAESNSISKCIKWVKENKPELKWIISFADGMMGKVGTIYQTKSVVCTGTQTFDPVVFSLSTFLQRPHHWSPPNILVCSIFWSPLKFDTLPTLSFCPPRIINCFEYTLTTINL